MALPRVFISSTYYDLKQVRNNIGDFIRNLGYEAIMHEKSGVAYTQNNPLEKDCYSEISSCDIVVCIIGNHFGTQSMDNDLSITMNELETAIKNKKKIYVFISNDVYIENKTYEQNKDSGIFKSAYTDDIKIHEFISDLKTKVRSNVIESFETTDEIIETLRLQFAGLFQNFLSREASLTESKTAYDLQQTTDVMKELIQRFDEEQNEFFNKFASSIFANNMVLRRIKLALGMNESSFFAKNLTALDEFMGILGFKSVDVDNPFEDSRKYMYEDILKIKTLVLKNEVIDDNENIIDERRRKILDDCIIYNETDKEDDGLPF